MYDFVYKRVSSLREAAELLSASAEAKLLAGGQTLLPTMKQRLAAPAEIVDLGGVESLRGIAVEAGLVVVGAMTIHADVAASPVVEAAIPGLSALAGGIGDPHVRNRGTIGGSIANNDPAADYPAACLALAATIVTDRREIAADEFFTGLFETALAPGEIVKAVSFPIPDLMGYAKFRHPASRYALVGVCVARTGREVRVAVTGAGSAGVFRWTDAEAALAVFEPSALEGVTIAADGLNSDIHATAAYRAALIGVMAQRAVARALNKEFRSARGLAG